MARTRKPDHEKLFNLASQQAGYFTAEQATASGFSRQLVSHHAHRDTFIRVRRGLFRLTRFPTSPFEEVIAAWLGFDPQQAVVSHETALQIFDLGDVVPTTIHLTVPRSQRSRRAPLGVTLHTVLKPPGRDDVVTRHGIRVSKPARAIADAAAYGTAPEQIIRAVREALQRGLATRAELLAAGRRHGGRTQQLIRQALSEVAAR